MLDETADDSGAIDVRRATFDGVVQHCLPPELPLPSRQHFHGNGLQCAKHSSHVTVFQHSSHRLRVRFGYAHR